MAKRKSIECGTYTAYRAGCRCKSCRNARLAYRQSYSDERLLGTGQKLLPIKDLLDFAGKDFDRDALAEVLGVHKDTIRGWHSAPIGIDKYKADEYANRLGVHPSIIWGNAWYRVPFVMSKEDRKFIFAE